ncbi:MAG: choice-of-anchor D domain-containing protein [Myxococcota bacterium]
MPHRGRVLFLSLIVAGAWACDESEQLVSVAPVPVVSPERFDFGAVPLGATKRLSLQISNGGTAALSIEDVMVDAPWFVDRLELPLELAPGAQQLVDVGFRPTVLDPVTATLGLVTNAAETPSLSLPLSGEGADGVLAVSPEQLDLRNTPVGGARFAELLVENRGLADLSGEIRLEGVSFPGYFQRGSATLEGSFSVGARGQLPLDVAYQPLDPGDHSGVLRFEICTGRCGVEVQLDATAVAPTVRLEPPVLDFGDVGIGERRVRTLTVRNEGTEAVQLLDLGLRGGTGVSLTPPGAFPLNLSAGGVLVIDVAFAPAEALELSGGVRVQLDDSSFPEVQAGLRGRGVGPLFVVQPERIAFGVVTAAGDESRRAMVALNAGSADVEVTEVRLDGNSAFSLQALPGLPVTLRGGETLPIDVRFRPSALGVVTATVTLRSTDPQRAEVRVPLEGGLAERVCVIDVDPPTVNFGAVVPMFRRDRKVLLSNRGTEDCRLLGGSFRSPSDPAVTRLGPDPFPVTLTQGQSLELDFRYLPTAEQESKVIYTVRTDEPLYPFRNVALVGTGAGYLDLFTRPRVVDFGEVRPNCPEVVQEVELVNAGSSRVDVTGFTLTSSTPEFRLDAPASATLAPGTVQAFRVGYDAADLGDDVAIVQIDVRDLAFPIVVPIQGTGRDNPVVVDTFEQQPRRDVDVLFVIDDSCSMGDEQLAIARNFMSFIRQANLRQVDFRLGVTTTTVLGTGGGLVGPPISPNTANLEGEFSRQTAVGTRGSGLEQGLEATLAAVVRAERGLLPNVNLFRAQTPKVFVVISDEDDFSPAPELTYAAQLRNRFGQIETAVVSGQSTGCQSSDGSATPSPRYERFVQDLSGQSYSICGDWAGNLASIGQTAFGLAVSFDLSRTPVASTVEVRINGTRQSSGYTVDVSLPAVVFASPPPEGARIEVRYTPECGS